MPDESRTGSSRRRAWLQVKSDNVFAGVDVMNAYEGLAYLDYDIQTFYAAAVIEGLTPSDLVVGGVRECRAALRALKVPAPKPMDYPVPLHGFLGRDLHELPLEAAVRGPYPTFLKPSSVQKAFTGFVMRSILDYDRVAHLPDDLSVWQSGVVEFVSEYRVFVHAGVIIGAKHYSGDYRVTLDWNVVDTTIQAWMTAPVSEQPPIAYALDFGCTAGGDTLLVECNDFWALGSYDLSSVPYAQALAARWKEMVAGY